MDPSSSIVDSYSTLPKMKALCTTSCADVMLSRIDEIPHLAQLALAALDSQRRYRYRAVLPCGRYFLSHEVLARVLSC